jgi:hypothetical protein
MTAMKPTSAPRSTIPCYAADGTSLGQRPLDAAQRLVAGTEVNTRPLEQRRTSGGKQYYESCRLQDNARPSDSRSFASA